MERSSDSRRVCIDPISVRLLRVCAPTFRTESSVGKKTVASVDMKNASFRNLTNTCSMIYHTASTSHAIGEHLNFFVRIDGVMQAAISTTVSQEIYP
jgi:hypothetical protein